ncbi:MAG: HYR domain-containing protein [Saprospiraceae bacterium]|nr:HYR domain-containing protein [Saprospiraceae bacterium]
MKNNGGWVKTVGLYTLAFTGNIDDLEIASGTSNHVTILNDIQVSDSLVITSVNQLYSSSGNGHQIQVKDDVVINDAWANNGSYYAVVSLVGDNDQTFDGIGQASYINYAKPSGNWIINTANTNFIKVEVTAGTWTMQNDNTSASSGYILDGGKIGGSGTVNGNVTCSNGGGLAPGASPGCITINGNLTLNAGTSFEVDIEGNTPCTEHDQTIVNGTVTINGATITGVTVTQPTTSIVIIDNDGTDAISGSKFSGATEGSFINVGGSDYTISYIGGDGNDVTLTGNNPPTATCQNLTVSADASCEDATTVAADFDNGSTDPEGDPITFSVDIAPPYSLGITSVVLTATDDNGASSTCDATITVEDDTPPTITCPANVTVNSDAGQCDAVVTVTQPTFSDNCSGSFTPELDGISNTNTLTIETWIKPDGQQSPATAIIFNRSSPDGACGLNFAYNNNSANTQIGYHWTNNSGTWNWAGGPAYLPDEWNHVALVIEPSQATIYVTNSNGTVSAVNTYSHIAVDLNTLWYIGDDTCCNGREFDGTIDEVRIWNTALTETEILANMNTELTGNEANLVLYYNFNQGIADGNNAGVTTLNDQVGSVNGNLQNFALTGTTSNWVAGQAGFGNALQIDGSDDRVPFNDLAPVNTLTIENNFNNSDNASGTYPAGIATVTWTATDEAGNTATCEQTVTVTDNENPTITCPANVSVSSDANACEATGVSLGTATSTDNCSVDDVSNNGTEPYALGNTTVTWTATDAAGNTGTCNQTVTVTDDQDPTITCAADVDVDTDAGQCDANVTVPAPTIDDNCGFAAGGGGNSGLPPVTDNLVHFYDFSGNANDIAGSNNGTVSGASLSQDPCDNDNSAYAFAGGSQEITLASQSGRNYPSGDFTISAWVKVNAYTQWAGILDVNWAYSSYGPGYTSGIFFGFKDNVPAMIFMDNNHANSGGEAENLLVSDTGFSTGEWHHVATVRDATAGMSYIYIDGALSGSMATSTDPVDYDSGSYDDNSVNIGHFRRTGYSTDALNGSLDQVGIWDRALSASELASLAANTCGGGGSLINDYTGTDDASGNYPVGPTLVTWTSTDENGNTATCEQTVTVTDNEAPTAICQDLTLELDENGQASITVDDINNGSDDACGIASLSLNTTDFTCAEVGTQTVTLTVTDNNGNTSNCTATITVEDNLAPGGGGAAITYPAPATILSNVAEASQYELVYQLNIPNSANWDNQNQVPYAVNNTAALGAVNFDRIAYYMELDGEWVWVSADAFTTNINQTGIPTDWVFYGPINNMNVASNKAGIVTGEGITTGNIEFWSNCYQTNNAYGISGASSSTYDFGDVMTSTDCYGSFQIHNYGESQTLFGYNRWSNSGNSDLGIGNQVGGSGHPDWTFAVNANQYTTKRVYVFVRNVAAGSGIACLNPTVQLDNTGTASITVDDIDDNNTDNCGIASRSLDVSSFTCAEVGENTVVLTLTDDSGNSNTCTATVTVEDQIAPTAICQDITVDLDGTGSIIVAGTDIDDSSDDACGISELNAAPSSFNCTNLGTNTVTLTVTDNNGNTNTCNATVTVEDNEAPTISVCPSDQSIPLGVDCEAVMDNYIAQTTASDNCSFTLVQSPAAGTTLSGTGTETVTITATDQGGLTSTCSFTLSKVDLIVPSITCPTPIVQDNDGGQCDAVVSFFNAATATDYCDATPDITYSPASGTAFAVGNTTVTATATDDSGNAASCDFIVTILDAEAPELSCPTDTIFQNVDASACTTNVSFTVTATDNCDTDVSLNSSHNSGDEFNVGIFDIYFTATDDAANTSTCSFPIKVSDDQAPTISCPADVNTVTDANVCTATLTFTATASDNCNQSPTITFSPASGSAFNTGLTTVTATASDGYGNTAECTFEVTVTDNQAPVLTCPTILNNFTTEGRCDATVSFAVTATDNCNASPLVTGSHNSGDNFGVGTTTVTYTADDEDGNTSTCTFNVVVIDNQLPVITCPANITQDNDPGQCSAVVTFAATATDNCASPPALAYSKASGTIFDLGTTSVTVTANDGNGNTASCSFDVTVNDTELPTVTCPANISVNNDPGVCEGTVAVPVPVTSDNCSQASLLGNGLDFDGANDKVSIPNDPNLVVGTSSFTWEAWVKTNSGILSTHQVILEKYGYYADGSKAQQSMVILANTGKILFQLRDNASHEQNPQSTTVVADNEWHHIAIVRDQTNLDQIIYIDGVEEVNVPLIQTGTISTIAPLNIGWSDPFGRYLKGIVDEVRIWNVARSASEIQASMNAQLSGTEPGLKAYYDFNQGSPGGINTGETTLFDSGVNGLHGTLQNFSLNGSTSNWVGGAMSTYVPLVASNDFNAGDDASGVYPLGTTNVTWTVTDLSGNENTCVQTITVIDNENPTVSCPGTQSIVLNSTCDATLGDYINQASAGDNCSAAANISITQTPAANSAISGYGPMTVVMTATDEAGNNGTCSFTVNKLDQQIPTIDCPADQTIALGTGCSVNMPDYTGDAVTVDNCGAPVVTQTPASGGAYTGLGTTLVTLTATDVAGNTASCEFNVTREDQTPPEIVCPPAQSLTLDGNCEASLGDYAYLTGTADNCSTTLSQTPTPGTTLNGAGTEVVTMTVTDISNNSTSCTFNVAKIDNTPASITTCPADRVVDMDANCQATVPDMTGELVVSDNCSGGYTVTQSPAAGAVLSVPNNYNQGVVMTVTDANGNNTACIVNLNILDNSVPAITCPATQTVEVTANCEATLPNYIDLAIVSDNCSSVLDIAVTQSPAEASTVSIAGSEQITLTATDEAGNENTCEFTLNKVDLTNPTAVCNDLTVTLVDRNTYTLSQAEINAIANGTDDNCDFSYVLGGQTSYDCSDRGNSYTVTLTVTDASGNTDDCTAQVLVVDPNSVCNDPPTAVCQDISVNLDADCTVSIANDAVNNGSSDPDGDVLTYYLSQTALSGHGNTVVTMIVSDGEFSDECTATVTTVDVTAPVADIATLTDAIAQCSIELVPPTATDACDGFITATTTDPTEYTVQGTYSVTWTYTDLNNNSSTQTQTVIVDDTTPLELDCPENKAVELSATSCEATLADYTGEVVITDNCGSATLNQAPAAGTVYTGTQTYTVTVTGTDLGGNTASCSFSVELQDNTNPTAICQDHTVQLDATGNGSITNADIDNGSNDACGVASLSLDVTDFDCSDVGGGNYALDFNGNVGVIIPKSPDLNPSVFTISAWVNPDAVIGSWRAIVSSRTSGSGYTLYISPQGQFQFWRGWSSMVNGPTVTAGVWTHVAGTYDGNTFRFYINGQLVGSNTQPMIINTTTNVHIGSVSDQSTWRMYGMIDEVRIFNQAHTTFTGNEPGLVAYYDMEDGTGSSTLTDRTGNGHNGTLSGMNPATAWVTPGAGGASSGGHTVTLTVTDVNGNTSNCAATITVEDNIAPVANCQPLTLQLNSAGTASTTAAAVNNGSSDACGIESLVLSQTAFNCNHLGSNDVTLTVTDVNGNESSCNTTVTVVDIIHPTALCKNVTIQLNGLGNMEVLPSQVNNGSYDNCLIDDLSLSTTIFYCNDVGVSTVTLTATDNSGNQSTCTATITIEDNDQPVIVCPPFNTSIPLYLDNNCSAGIPDLEPSLVNATDNCSYVITQVPAIGTTVSYTGPQFVQMKATDPSGNYAVCDIVLDVIDDILPEALCNDLNVNLDVNGMASITKEMVDNGSSDGCGIQSMSINQANFTCAHVGGNTVTLTVTDINSNVNTCESTVTIFDVTAPIAHCNNVVIYLDANGETSVTTGQVDNNSWDACGIASVELSQTDFDCSEVGVNNVTMIVTDNNSNVKTCQAEISVVDNILPTMSCQDATVVLDEFGNASITAIDIDNGSSDNCAIDYLNAAPNTFTCANTGSNTVTLTATDVNGNVNTCNAMVTVQDNTDPVALCQDYTVELDVDGLGSATAAHVNAGSSDICGIQSLELSLTDYDCSMIGDHAVVLTVTDNNNNVSTCDATVTVVDLVPADAQCLDFTLPLDEFGDASITVDDVDYASTDACGIDTRSIDVTAFDCSMVGDNNVTLSLVDVNGNNSSCIAVVTVVDITPATALCQDLTIELSNGGYAFITKEEVDNGSNDACGVQTLALSQTAYLCEHLGANTVTLTVTDVNGNESTCDASITVEDNILPVALCHNLVLQLDETGAANITPADIDNGSSDNCGFTLSLSDENYGCADVGPNLVTMTITDDAGNTATCQSTIIVKDQVAPDPGCEDYTLSLDEDGEGCITAEDVTANVSDACGISSIFFLQTSNEDNKIDNGKFSGGTSDWTKYNISNGGGWQSNGGNSGGYFLLKGNNDCSSDPTIKQFVGGLKPGKTYTISGQYYGDGNSSASSFGILVDNVVVAQLPNPGPNWTDFSVMFTASWYSHTISFKGEMNCDDTDYGIDNIKVNKSYTINGMCFDCAPGHHHDHDDDDDDDRPGDLAGDGQKSSSDGGWWHHNDDDDYQVLGLGDHLVTMIVTDNNGNTATCLATVSVIDDLAPVAKCRNTSVSLGNDGEASLEAYRVNKYSYDNCGVDDYSVSPSDFDCSHVGDNVVVLTVTDNSGNTSTCEATVTVEDNKKPHIHCLQNKTLIFDETCTAIMPDYTDNATVSDNCSAMVTQYPEPGTVLTQSGSIKVTLTATDPGGNSKSDYFYLYLSDQTPPEAICHENVTVEIVSGGHVEVTPDMIDNGSSDACGIKYKYIPYNCNNYFDCSDIGETFVVTLKVRDFAGNQSTCESNVTISAGTEDSDCDGVPDGCDQCPGGDDSVDNNNDGYPDCAYRPNYSQIISDWKCGKKKVYMCHKTWGDNTITICVSYNSVYAHLKHGDYIGYCGNAPCGDELNDTDDRTVTKDLHQHFDEELIEKDQDMVLFPNPASDYIFIGIKGFIDQDVNLRIFDQLGNQVWMLEIPESQEEMVQLNLRELGLASGLYTVMLQSEGMTITKRLVFSYGERP